ncbi:hypothetical protein EJB05_29334 [Eragrostis curvula]|uniref:Zinc finger PHD-type domain-containing protein n=1 Tax=Eragrostis curvula TaxID=38414 RepID=A0A5J9USN0_9POAL|nr:hypothetical protein EJB05_29334 [Eragrostis curvula]
MDVVCEVCGDVGFKHLLLQCSNCKNSTRHRYCMDTIDYDGVIEWLCDDCLPNQNQLMESDVDRVEVSMELPSWGHHQNRSTKAKRGSSKLQNGGTFSQSCENDGQVKKNRTHGENGVMNLTRSVENRAEALRPGILDDQNVDNHRQSKKKKSIEANDDGNGILGDPNGGCAQMDNAQLTSQDVVAAEHNSLSRMLVISAPTDQQCDISTQPIDEPYWTYVRCLPPLSKEHFKCFFFPAGANNFTFHVNSGLMKIGQEYISLAAHLSNHAHKKVHELSRSLPPVMKVTNHPKFKAWPNRWQELEPTAKDIGLYFFSDNMRPNKDLDRLVQYVTDHRIVLKYVFGFVELLIFPSVFLPEQSQMFQGKHYLWGVFKPREATSKGDSAVRNQDRTPQAAKKIKDRQDKVQGDTLDQEKHVSNHSIPNDNQPLPVTVNGVGTETIPCDDEEARSSSEAPAPEVLVLVNLEAPRSEHYIRELVKEGARSVTGNGLAEAGPARL